MAAQGHSAGEPQPDGPNGNVNGNGNGRRGGSAGARTARRTPRMLPDDRHRAEEETPGWIRDARAGGVLPATNGEAPIDEQETARVPSLAAIEILKKQWLN